MPKIQTVLLSSDLVTELVRLCRDLDTLNPRHTDKEGNVLIGPGRLANWQETTHRLLPELEKLK